MQRPEKNQSEEIISSLVLLSVFCLFSFAAVWAAPLPPTNFLAQVYLRYFTGILAATCLWCTYKEISSAKSGHASKLSTYLWPLLLVGVAAWLRFRNLTAIDIWADEDNQISGAFVRENLVVFAAGNHQAPLDYFNSHLMQKINGVSLFTARLWPALLGSLATLPFYRLLRNFMREESAILGAVFFLGNTLLWSLSQEGRPYMAAVFLFVISLCLWVAFFRNPEKRHLWVALAAAQSALFISLTMQPQFAFGFYFIPLVLFTLARKQMHLKEYAAALILSGILALPVMLTAAIKLPEERQIQPFASGFILEFLPRMLEVALKSLGPLIWAAPLLPISLFLKGRDSDSPSLGKSLLALSLIYPILFFFVFEAVLSTPVAPRYITFFVVLYLFGLTYSLDRLASIRGYKFFAIACGTLFFLASAITAESLKEREPAWRQFFEHISQNELSSGVGAVLDFPLDWPFPVHGFRGAYIYSSLYKEKLSIRSNSDETLSATGDLIWRLRENPNAKFAYLFVPEESPRNLLYGLKIPPSPERKILRFDQAEAIRIVPKNNSLARAVRETLQQAGQLEPRILNMRSYSELMAGLYMLENNCSSARAYWAKLPPPNQGYRHVKTFNYLSSLFSERCEAR